MPTSNAPVGRGYGQTAIDSGKASAASSLVGAKATMRWSAIKPGSDAKCGVESLTDRLRPKASR
jgi:hypothetical protein